MRCEAAFSQYVYRAVQVGVDGNAIPRHIQATAYTLAAERVLRTGHIIGYGVKVKGRCLRGITFIHHPQVDTVLAALPRQAAFQLGKAEQGKQLVVYAQIRTLEMNAPPKDDNPDMVLDAVVRDIGRCLSDIVKAAVLGLVVQAA